MPDNQPTARFLEGVNRGSDSAAKELDHRYRQRLCALVERQMYHIFRAREDPEDVVQTVLRTFFRRAAKGEFQLQHCGELWALLATITRNKVLKRAEAYRTRKRNPHREEPYNADQLAGHEPDGLDLAIAAELIEKTVQGLDPSYAEAFQLRLQGFTETEIASQLGGTRVAVRYKLQRIRERLARLARAESGQ